MVNLDTDRGSTAGAEERATSPTQQSPLQNYYEQIHVDVTKSNVYKPTSRKEKR